VGFAVFVDEETEPGRKQCPRHLRECKEEQSASPVCIDGSNRREREPETAMSKLCQRKRDTSSSHKVDETKAPRRQKCDLLGSTCLHKYSRRIESNDVD
jgi:hypothetical protein